MTEIPEIPPAPQSLALVALRSAADSWPVVKSDPGLVLQIVRCGFAAGVPDSKSLQRYLESLDCVIALESVASKTSSTSDSTSPQVEHAGRLLARLASCLADATHLCDSDAAWMGGLLAPLGWFLLARDCPDRVSEYFSAKPDRESSTDRQQRMFGTTAAALARRYNIRHGLPAWLAVITGHLALPCELAASLGADPGSFRVVRTSAAVLDRFGFHLGIVETDAVEAVRDLGLSPEQVFEWCRELLESGPAIPHDVSIDSLAGDIVHLSRAFRQLRDGDALERLQQQIDVLQQALRSRVNETEKQLLERKLTAMAEFAAGAAHEINNPMAVISGNAQFLLAAETDPERRQRLLKIIGQTQRVQSLLTDVFRFARPTPPRKTLVDLEAVLEEAILQVHKQAEQAGVTLECPEPPEPITLYVDARQIAYAIACLLRNAIEASPPGGCVRLEAVAPSEDRICIAVEDEGPGLEDVDFDLACDPFYSGKSAGRGRGLGLSIAWRYAQLHGGEVTYERSNERTRFCLTLPKAPRDVGQGNGTHLSTTAELAR